MQAQEVVISVLLVGVAAALVVAQRRRFERIARALRAAAGPLGGKLIIKGRHKHVIDATPTDLGEIRSEHPGRNLDAWIATPMIAFAGGYVAIAFGQRWLLVIPLVVCVLWVALTLSWTPRRVILREDGLEVHRYFRRPVYLRFADCSRVYREFSVLRSVLGTGVSEYILKLVDRNGQVVRLNPRVIRDATHLFARTERLAIFPKHQALKDLFHAGEQVAFGGITTSREGIRLGSKLVEWSDLRQVELSPKVLIFRINGVAPRTAALAEVPFPWALLSILEM